MKTKHLFLWLLFCVFAQTKAQTSNVIIDNSEPMEVCNLSTTTLQAHIDFTRKGLLTSPKR